MSQPAEKLYIFTANDFLDRELSLGNLGDIREIPLEEAAKRLDGLRQAQQLGRTSIALLGIRTDNPASDILPDAGFIYPIYPSPVPDNTDYRDLRQDFVVAGIPGELHAYNSDLYVIGV